MNLKVNLTRTGSFAKSRSSLKSEGCAVGFVIAEERGVECGGNEIQEARRRV